MVHEDGLFVNSLRLQLFSFPILILFFHFSVSVFLRVDQGRIADRLSFLSTGLSRVKKMRGH